MKWGTDKADEAGVPAYLEGSAIGRTLYERHGFEEVGEMVTDYGKYGVEGKERLLLMTRHPRTTHGDMTDHDARRPPAAA